MLQSKHVNMVALDVLAQWQYPTHEGRAIAIVCDVCLESGRNIINAVEFDGDAAIYHPLTALRPATATKIHERN